MYLQLDYYKSVSSNDTIHFVIDLGNQNLTLWAAHITFFVGLISMWLSASVAWYEISGKMAPFRTVTNQIESSAIISVRHCDS